MMQKISLNSRLCVLIALLALVSGCDSSTREEATGRGEIRGINSLVDSPDLLFLIEEFSLDSVSFKSASGFAEYDDLTYDFSFDYLLPGETDFTRLATLNVGVIADMQHTVVLTGSVANPSFISWEAPIREFADDETGFEADFTHQSPLLGAIDVYYAPMGTVPMVADRIGTLNNGERLPYREFEQGSFEIIITLVDDPGNPLFQSGPVLAQARTRITFAIFDTDPSITANFAVSLINAGGGSANLFDVNSPSNVRILHSAFGTDNFDGYFNNDFSNVIFPNIAFGMLSAYTDIESIATPFTLTQVGNIGVSIFEAEFFLSRNVRRTILFGGAPGSLLFRELADDARPIAVFPVVRVTNMSANTESLDIYLLEPGTEILEETIPLFGGVVLQIDTGFFGQIADIYEMTVTLNGETAPVSAPLLLDIANGDFVDIVIFDTVDPAVVDLVIIDSSL